MKKDYLDKSLQLDERIKLKKQAMKKLLNPFAKKDFDPDNFEPLATPEEKEVCYRKRVKPPKKLPLFGLKPKEVMEGQMIGMYESKQDLYLLFAHRCNDLQTEIDNLKEIVQKQSEQIKNLTK